MDSAKNYSKDNIPINNAENCNINENNLKTFNKNQYEPRSTSAQLNDQTEKVLSFGDHGNVQKPELFVFGAFENLEKQCHLDIPTENLSNLPKPYSNCHVKDVVDSPDRRSKNWSRFLRSVFLGSTKNKTLKSTRPLHYQRESALNLIDNNKPIFSRKENGLYSDGLLCVPKITPRQNKLRQNKLINSVKNCGVKNKSKRRNQLSQVHKSNSHEVHSTINHSSNSARPKFDFNTGTCTSQNFIINDGNTQSVQDTFEYFPTQNKNCFEIRKTFGLKKIESTNEIIKNKVVRDSITDNTIRFKNCKNSNTNCTEENFDNYQNICLVNENVPNTFQKSLFRLVDTNKQVPSNESVFKTGKIKIEFNKNSSDKRVFLDNQKTATDMVCKKQSVTLHSGTQENEPETTEEIIFEDGTPAEILNCKNKIFQIEEENKTSSLIGAAEEYINNEKQYSEDAATTIKNDLIDECPRDKVESIQNIQVTDSSVSTTEILLLIDSILEEGCNSINKTIDKSNLSHCDEVNTCADNDLEFSFKADTNIGNETQSNEVSLKDFGEKSFKNMFSSEDNVDTKEINKFQQSSIHRVDINSPDSLNDPGFKTDEFTNETFTSKSSSGIGLEKIDYYKDCIIVGEQNVENDDIFRLIDTFLEETTNFTNSIIDESPPSPSVRENTVEADINLNVSSKRILTSNNICAKNEIWNKVHGNKTEGKDNNDMALVDRENSNVLNEDCQGIPEMIAESTAPDKNNTLDKNSKVESETLTQQGNDLDKNNASHHFQLREERSTIENSPGLKNFLDDADYLVIDEYETSFSESLHSEEQSTKSLQTKTSCNIEIKHCTINKENFKNVDGGGNLEKQLSANIVVTIPNSIQRTVDEGIKSIVKRAVSIEILDSSKQSSSAAETSSPSIETAVLKVDEQKDIFVTNTKEASKTTVKDVNVFSFGRKRKLSSDESEKDIHLNKKSPINEVKNTLTKDIDSTKSCDNKKFLSTDNNTISTSTDTSDKINKKQCYSKTRPKPETTKSQIKKPEASTSNKKRKMSSDETKTNKKAKRSNSPNALGQDSEELADCLNPNWSKYMNHSPKECFELIKKQWGSSFEVDPNIDLTLRYQEQEMKVFTNSFFNSTNTNSLSCENVFQNKFNFHQNMVYQLQSDADNLYLLKRCYDHYVINNRINELMRSRGDHLQQIEHLRKNVNDLEYFFSFYPYSVITQPDVNFFEHQRNVSNKIFDFYQKKR